MPSTEFKSTSPNVRSDYREFVSTASEVVLPEFMSHDLVMNAHWDGLFEDFSDYQFALVSQESGVIAGIANSVPLSWTDSVEDLPDEGWDWALTKSALDFAEGVAPNVLCGLQISVAPSFQGRGLRKLMLNRLIDLAHTNELHSVIMPVRPSMKSRYPLASIDAYIRWTNDRGLPYDPWLRIHVRNGGRIVKPCPLSMKVTGTVDEWQEWTGLRFFESGEYVVPGALTPVSIDLEEDQGVYVEPNVWVVHTVA
jgi:GNAT superfamily N-acetyltransferase